MRSDRDAARHDGFGAREVQADVQDADHGEHRPPGSGPKLQTTITERLRSDIVSRRYAPGQRLTEEHLAHAYGVSRVPVRGALHHLEAEGFTRTIPYVGAAVAELSDAEADDLLEVKISVVSRTVRRAAERRTHEELRQFEQILGEAEAAQAELRLEALDELEGRFHRVIAQAAGITHLRQLLALLSAKIEWMHPGGRDARSAACWREHLDLFVAIGAADPHRASSIVDGHIRRSDEIRRSAHA
ncbi:MAG: HTH-type transcriptional repressor CsiR [Acidimicrobiaceae bacterium]|nr:HTH-type transcriptional repressor CsiR [Acidimicrobiaceae bacterium]